MYRNKGDLTFENVSSAWGLDVPSYSNGGVYVDLDNDGDLDLVVNNIDEPALIFQNHADKLLVNNYLKIKLLGSEKNRFGIGAKVEVWTNGNMQYQEQNPVRGFQSSVECLLHFGLGKSQNIDYVKITWVDGKSQVLENVKPNQTLFLDYKNAQNIPDIQSVQSATVQTFQAIPDLVNFEHRETEHIDFKQQFTLPHKFSQNGFGIAVGDINGDGLDDFYAGGAYGMSGSFFIQNKLGQFQEKKLTIDTLHEDLGVLLFDADNDKDLDLYIVSGGSERLKETDYYQDRLYLNDGKGNFSLAENALPDTKSSGSCVVACDFDQDGVYLQGDGKGNFKTIPNKDSGFLVKGDAKGMAEIFMPTSSMQREAKGRLIHLVAINSEGIKAVENQIINTQKIVSILPNEKYAILMLKNGKKRKHEFYYGSTYLSQSSRILKIDKEVIDIEVIDDKGKSRKIKLN
jgi:hypothetical protein